MVHVAREEEPGESVLWRHRKSATRVRILRCGQFGSVLEHFPDHIQAIATAAMLTDTIVITGPISESDEPTADFFGSAQILLRTSRSGDIQPEYTGKFWRWWGSRSTGLRARSIDAYASNEWSSCKHWLQRHQPESTRLRDALFERLVCAKSVRVGEYKAEHDTMPFAMARRPNAPPSQEQLTASELLELRRKLEAMPRHELEIFYKATHNARRYVMRLPSARLIQELVQAWKILRKYP